MLLTRLRQAQTDINDQTEHRQSDRHRQTQTETLENNQIQYFSLNGNWEDRFEKAREIIDAEFFQK